jgi:hypothetical protein
MTLMQLVVAALATWQIVEIWHHSSLFAELRAELQAEPDGFITNLLLCPWCLSVWVGLGVWIALSYPPYHWIDEWFDAWKSQSAGVSHFLAGLVLLLRSVPRICCYAFAISRLANLASDLSHSVCRTPGSRALNPDLGASRERDTELTVHAGDDPEPASEV